MEGPGLEFSEAVIDNGKYGRHTIRFESGILAQQADGSAAVYLDGDTMLLAATTAAKAPRDAIDFFPLTVDIEERMYAAGRIPGSFFRREGRPGEGAILAARLIDRPLRPAFVKGLRNEVQVIVDVLSLNPAHYYDVVAINAASMATTLAGLPFSGPIGGVRVALIDETWVCFPTVEQVARSSFQMVVAGRVLPDGDVAIMMVEAGGTESTWENVRSGRTAPTEEVVGQGLEAAKPFIKTLCDAQSELKAKLPKETFDFPVFRDYEDDIYAAVEELATDRVSEAMRIPGKQDRDDATHAIRQDVTEALAERFEGRGNEIAAALKSLTKKIVRHRTLTEGVRIDGRGTRDIRTLSAEVAVIPRVHGSALFQRGETQILGVSTLNMLDMEQKIDTLSPPAGRGRWWVVIALPPGPGQQEQGRQPDRGQAVPDEFHWSISVLSLLAGARTRPRPGRSRRLAHGGPLRPDGARHRPGAAHPGGVPLRDPPGLRGHRLQRFHLDGFGVRIHPGPAERGRAAEGSRRGHRHGVDERGDRR